MVHISKIKEPLVWVDLEMTGLSVNTDVILEGALVITDVHLNVIAQGPHIVVHQSDEVLNNMDEWCVQTHTLSGLVNSVKQSKYSINDLDTQWSDFIDIYCDPKSGLLAGNSIWQDRLFIQKYLPRFTRYLHYKMIDVSSVQQLVRQWYKCDTKSVFKKAESHRAISDIYESIAELAYYKKHFFFSSK